MQSDAIEELRRELLKLKPTGKDGFEGLVAHALSHFTSERYRLSSSGRQNGRDGSASLGSSHIFFEAKHYSKKAPPAEELQSKLMSAINDHGACLDAWALTLTTALGDGAADNVRQTAESHGVEFILLDWNEHPLPLLAVLLAAVKEETCNWLQKNKKIDLKKIRHGLDEIEKHTAYQRVKTEIEQKLSIPTAGYSNTKEKNRQWMEECFSSHKQAQRIFGQFIAPRDNAFIPIARPKLDKEISDAILKQNDADELIVLLGKEGTGKTWGVATAWLSISEETRPILLLCTSKQAPSSEGEAENLLAKLLNEQTGSYFPIERWNKRIENWKRRETDNSCRIILVLDGLNERESKRWVEIINKQYDLKNNLGLKIVLTSRPGFFQQHIEPRLFGYDINRVNVPEFSIQQVKEGLEKIDCDHTKLSEATLNFICNPRIFLVATSLLSELPPNDLTKDRLLFEYWKKRLEERGDGIRHTDNDIKNLIISHVKKIKETTSFPNFEWKEHSSIAKRRSDVSIEDELTEIEEGRFFEPEPNNNGTYCFRKESFPYAIGLMIVDELKHAARENRDVSNFSVQIVEPISGFDRMAEIMSAAACISCLDKSCPLSVSVAIICQALSLQNSLEEVVETLAAYVDSCPQAFIESVERLWSSLYIDKEILIWILLSRSRASNAQIEIDNAIRKWLRFWTPNTHELFRPKEAGAEQDKYNKEQQRRLTLVKQRIANLSKIELEAFNNCKEVESDNLASLRDLAVVLLAKSDLSQFVEDIFRSQIAHYISPRVHGDGSLLFWLFRFNVINFENRTSVFRKHLEEAEKKGLSEVGVRAVSRIYSVISTYECALEENRLKEQLPPPKIFPGWNIADKYCDVNFLDPNSEEPTNLENAVKAINALKEEKISDRMSTSPESNLLDIVVGPLARFNTPSIVKKLRSIIMQSRELDKNSLYFLVINRFKNLSPFFRKRELELLEELYRTIAGWDWDVSKERRITPQFLLLSMLPHLKAEKQLEFMLLLNDKAYELLELGSYLKPLSSQSFEKHLKASLKKDQEGKESYLRRVLFFAAYGKTPLTNNTRNLLIELLTHKDSIIRTLIFETACSLNDKVLLSAIRESNWSAEQSHLKEQSQEKFYGSKALFYAFEKIEDVKQLRRMEVSWQIRSVDKLSPDMRSASCSVLKEGIKNATCLTNLKTEDGTVSREFLKDEKFSLFSTELNNHSGDDISQFFKKLANPKEEELLFKKRHEFIKEEINKYLEELYKKGNEFLCDYVSPSVLLELSKRESCFLEDITKLVVDAKDENLRNIFNVALSVAVAISETAPKTTVEIFNRLKKITPFVRFIFSSARLPSQTYMCWKAKDALEIKEYRKSIVQSLSDDSQIYDFVLNAEYTQKQDGLWSLIDELVKSNNPTDLARAVTLAGFVNTDNRVEQLFNMECFKLGFLNEVMEIAKKRYKENEWARHWFEKALQTNNHIDFWRYIHLMTECADKRYVLWFYDQDNNASETFRTFSPLYKEKLKNKSDKKQKELEKTLFGYKVPNNTLLTALAFDD